MSAAYDYDQNVHNLPRADRSPTGETERSGQAVVSMLRQAADVAQRNEERAKAQAHAMARELQAAEARIRALEIELRSIEQRAIDAEQWLLHVYQEAKTVLLDPLVERSQTR